MLLNYNLATSGGPWLPHPSVGSSALDQGWGTLGPGPKVMLQDSIWHLGLPLCHTPLSRLHLLPALLCLFQGKIPWGLAVAQWLSICFACSRSRHLQGENLFWNPGEQLSIRVVITKYDGSMAWLCIRLLPIFPVTSLFFMTQKRTIANQWFPVFWFCLGVPACKPCLTIQFHTLEFLFIA